MIALNPIQQEEVMRKVAKCMPWILLFEFFQVFNENIFSLITPDLAVDFGISPSTVSLVVTLGKLFFGVAAIVFTALSDIMSIRKLVLFSCFVFPVVTVLGLFIGDSFTLLILFRVLFAITIAAPVALQIVIAIKYFDKLTAAKYFGYNAAIFQLAAACGNLFGGYIAEYLHWKVTFLIPLITVIGVPIIYKNLPKDDGKTGKFDILGVALLTVISALLITFMTFKMEHLSLFIFALIFIGLFVFHTVKSKDPFVKPILFKTKGIVWSLVVCLLFYGTQIGFAFIFPFIVKSVYGMSVSIIGTFYMITNVAAFITGMLTGKIIRKIGHRNIGLLGGIFILAGLGVVTFLVGYSVVFPFLGMGLFNIGYALFFSGYLTNYTQLLPADQQGAGIGIEKLVLNIGSSLGGAFVAMLYGQQFMMGKIVDTSSKANSGMYSNIALVLMIMIAVAIFIFVKVFNKDFNRVDNEPKETSQSRA